jgi:hypothetical protein
MEASGTRWVLLASFATEGLEARVPATPRLQSQSGSLDEDLTPAVRRHRLQRYRTAKALLLLLHVDQPALIATVFPPMPGAHKPPRLSSAADHLLDPLPLRTAVESIFLKSAFDEETAILAKHGDINDSDQLKGQQVSENATALAICVTFSL